MFDQGILQLIASAPSVQALIPNDAAGNPEVYWVLAPKGAILPYIVLSIVATSDVYTTGGATGTRAALVQVDCFSTTHYGSRAISLAVRQLLESYRGNLPDVNATAVTAVFTDKDWTMPYEEGSSKGFVFRSLLQFRVWYYDESFVMVDFVEGGTF